METDNFNEPLGKMDEEAVSVEETPEAPMLSQKSSN